MLFENEKLQEIITGSLPLEDNFYFDDTVFTTIDEDYVLMCFSLYYYLIGQIRHLSNLSPEENKGYVTISDHLYNSLRGKAMLSIEDIEEMYGDVLVQRYLERQRQEKKAKKLSNLSRGSSTHKENANFRHAQIISLVLNKLPKQDIADRMRISRSTVDRALRGLTVPKLNDIISQYKETVFYDLDWQTYTNFVGVDCSYPKFRKKLMDKIEK